jgi:hypothetical protein
MQDMWGKVLCRLGRHHWQRRSNDDGGAYFACTRCGKEHYTDGTESMDPRSFGAPG